MKGVGVREVDVRDCEELMVATRGVYMCSGGTGDELFESTGGW